MKAAGLFLLLLLLVFSSCKDPLVPKPRGYFRLDMPEKEYITFESDCPFQFSYPNYLVVNEVSDHFSEPCWFNLQMKDLNATIYLTYKPLKNNLGTHIEDVRSIVYKHIVKADDIREELIRNTESDSYGIIYDIFGNTASSVNFFITDSTHHFLSGSLYFNSIPNMDSLKPAIEFLRQDIVYLMNSTTWK